MSTLTAKVFQSGNSRALRLPRQLRLPKNRTYEIEPITGGFRVIDAVEREKRRRAVRKLMGLPPLRAEWPRP